VWLQCSIGKAFRGGGHGGAQMRCWVVSAVWGRSPSVQGLPTESELACSLPAAIEGRWHMRGKMAGYELSSWTENTLYCPTYTVQGTRIAFGCCHSMPHSSTHSTTHSEALANAYVCKDWIVRHAPSLCHQPTHPTNQWYSLQALVYHGVLFVTHPSTHSSELTE
jgi:hypothetical protein